MPSINHPAVWFGSLSQTSFQIYLPQLGGQTRYKHSTFALFHILLSPGSFPRLHTAPPHHTNFMAAMLTLSGPAKQNTLLRVSRCHIQRDLTPNRQGSLTY
jgi:hypothetical protein